MAAYVPKYAVGQRVPGMRGGSRIFFGREFGRVGAVSVQLLPTDPVAFKNLKAPVENPALWGMRERIIFEHLMYSAGYEIKKVLVDVIKGRGTEHGVKLAATSSATRILRGSASNAPLSDSGRLLNSLRVDVKRGVNTPQLKIHFEGLYPSGAMGYKMRPIGLLVEIIERGHLITVTPRMRKYFQTMAAVLVGSPEGQVYMAMSKKKVGAIMAVPPRPFVTESIKAGTKRFRAKYMTGPGRAEITNIIMGAWVRGRIRTGSGVRHRASLAEFSSYQD